MRWRLLKLDLPYLLGELVIVVLGVAIALTADRWRQGYQERELEAEYISRLQADVLYGQSLLDFRNLQIKRAAEANASLTNILSSDLQNADINVLADLFSRSAQVGFTPDDIGHHVTYLEMRDAGRLSIIRAPEIREALAEYYRRVDVLSSVWDGNSNNVLPRFSEVTGYPPYFFNTGVPVDGTGGLRNEMTEEIKLRIFNEMHENTEIILRELRRLNFSLVLLQDRMDSARESNLLLLEFLK